MITGVAFLINPHVEMQARSGSQQARSCDTSYRADGKNQITKCLLETSQWILNVSFMVLSAQFTSSRRTEICKDVAPRNSHVKSFPSIASRINFGCTGRFD